jgi:hypothetical protein
LFLFLLAVAAAAATAKIQAMEAVTNTAAVLGLTKEPSTPPLVVVQQPSTMSLMRHVPTIIPTMSTMMPSLVNPPQLITPTLAGGFSSKLSSVPPPGIAYPSLGILPTASSTPSSGK